MISPGEYFPEDSPEAVFLRSDLTELLQECSDDVVVHQDEDLNQPCEIILGGKIESTVRGLYLDITIVNWTETADNGVCSDAFNLTVGADQYDITADAIKDADYPHDDIDEDLIMLMRYWIRSDVTKWSKGQSRRIARAWQMQPND